MFHNRATEYDPLHDVFSSPSSYNADNIANILGALNSLKLSGGAAIDPQQVKVIFTGSYESAINMSGSSYPHLPRKWARIHSSRIRPT